MVSPSSILSGGMNAMRKELNFVGRVVKQSTLPLFVLCVAMAIAAPPFAPPFGTWIRLSPDPIVSPRGDGFESAGTFNPAVVKVKEDGKFVMLYRVEDPRLVKFGNTFYLTYTGYNNVDGIGADKKDAQLCLATSTDLVHWKRQGIVFPAYKGKWNVKWTKSGAIVPQKINGKYWMYFLADARGQDTQMGIAYSQDLLHWTEALDHPVLSSRPGSFDSQVVEPGPPPVLTSEGIFLIYNGADDKNIYSTGWVLFDKNDPTKILARAQEPVFSPGPEWEKVGQVPNVVFVEGLVRDGGRWLFYYGGADKNVGVATAPAR